MLSGNTSVSESQPNRHLMSLGWEANSRHYSLFWRANNDQSTIWARLRDLRVGNYGFSTSPFIQFSPNKVVENPWFGPYQNSWRPDPILLRRNGTRHLLRYLPVRAPHHNSPIPTPGPCQVFQKNDQLVLVWTESHCTQPWCCLFGWIRTHWLKKQWWWHLSSQVIADNSRFPLENLIRHPHQRLSSGILLCGQ